MSFATEYLVQLETFAAQGPLPRVRALHLPPGRFAQDNRGEFCALELEDGSIGLSYVLLDDTLERLLDGSDGLGLPGADTLAAGTPLCQQQWYLARPWVSPLPMPSLAACSTGRDFALTSVPTRSGI